MNKKMIVSRLKIFKKHRIILLFGAIAIFLLSGLIFDGKLFGRSLDSSVPPVSYLLNNPLWHSFSTWTDTINGGTRNTFGVTLVPVNTILYLPVLFGASPPFVAAYQMVATLFIGLFFFYLLARRLLARYSLSIGQKQTIAVVSSCFFVLNNYLFSEMIFGSNVMYLTFVFIPLFIYALLSYWELKRFRKFYFILALICLTIISSTMQHLVLAYLLIIGLAIAYKDRTIFFKLGVLHLLLSLYWILPLLFSINEVKSFELAKDYSSGLQDSPQLLDSLINSEYFSNRNMYRMALGNGLYTSIWTINAFVLLFASIFCLFKITAYKIIHRKIIIFSFIIFLVALLFSKGSHEPFGSFVYLLYQYFPPLKLFRSTQHFLSFYVIAISVLFVFSAIYFQLKKKIYIYFLLLVVIINASPWWLTRDLGKENLLGSVYYPIINQYTLTEGDRALYDLNKSPLDLSVLTIPPGLSIIFKKTSQNERSQGGDAGLMYGNKRFFATDQSMGEFSTVLDNLEHDMYTDADFFNKNANLFGILNIKYFIIRKDTAPNFSKHRKEFNLNTLEISIKQSNNVKTIYDKDDILILENKLFLPHIYIPCSISKVESIHDIGTAVLSSMHPFCGAVVANTQNVGIDLSHLPNNINNNSTAVEYKKISPTRYRVIIHRPSSKVPIIFSETFHPGWRIYATNNKLINKSEDRQSGIKDSQNLLENYQVYSLDQMTREELIESIDRGDISEVGEGGAASIVQFISRNNYGTIQNNNLPSGSIVETLFRRSSVDYHFSANGYSNGWLIDVDQLCSKGLCQIDSSGNKSVELVIEFWPQKLFSIGMLLSLVTLLVICYFLVNETIRLKFKNFVR